MRRRLGGRGRPHNASKLPLTRWFQAAYVLSQAKNNVSALELMRHLGVSYPTAWSLKHKLMEAMRERERTRTLQGTVQVDEAFLGGQASGHSSLGRKGKVPLLAAVSAAPDGKAAQVCFSAAGHRRRRGGVLPEHAGPEVHGGL
ncbi:MAG: IS1595 family transposase [Rhizobacter sp.]|nr:IS1595 family transposase [Rhizobacter sp.]